MFKQIFLVLAPLRRQDKILEDAEKVCGDAVLGYMVMIFFLVSEESPNHTSES